MEQKKRNFASSLLGMVVGAAVSSKAAPSDGATLRFPLTSKEKQSGVTPSNYGYPPGSFCRYGADPEGRTDSTVAINSALKCNAIAFDDHPGGAVYLVNNPLRFRSGGQILQGQGSGDRIGNASTVLKYSGKPGGKVVSVSNEAVNFSECTMRDLLIDGNHLADVGIEAYDDTLAGGSWRVRIQSVGIINVTEGKNSTAIYLGNRSAPNFANDIIVSGCFIANCGRGMVGTGSWQQINSSTFTGCSVAGVYAGDDSLGSSSAWTFNNCVFSSNKVDFRGFHISQASFSGCWFENSETGIYRAANAHSVSFVGCYLHTFCPEAMMDFGNAAGYYFFGGNFLPFGTKSTKISNVNPTSAGASFGQKIQLLRSNGTQVPAISQSNSVESGGAQTPAVLRGAESVSLFLGRGIHRISLTIHNTQNWKSRMQAAYYAFLHDGDNESVVEAAKSEGSGGSPSFSIACTNNQVTVTNTGDGAVSVMLSRLV